mmetsp:Transcript_95722/g.247484  ORF Transcript_95722/g.247484 Transcript_95722/m.247484 type:complete len:222 (-) Transcript_95722:67-732(-)
MRCSRLLIRAATFSLITCEASFSCRSKVAPLDRLSMRLSKIAVSLRTSRRLPLRVSTAMSCSFALLRASSSNRASKRRDKSLSHFSPAAVTRSHDELSSASRSASRWPKERKKPRSSSCKLVAMPSIAAEMPPGTAWATPGSSTGHALVTPERSPNRARNGASKPVSGGRLAASQLAAAAAGSPPGVGAAVAGHEPGRLSASRFAFACPRCKAMQPTSKLR